ncbi:LLM class flavin-dependent oxidoreductase [Nonomuraea sp. LP-02]|uniref:LLM class flavin-dependent oxidoreductase n=1 Tax=Nonomuraea sp. LP-02 TaxID=3097960 RepID=UPI002E30BB2F|nr:LLM class flavin-dependent oxidoreductase [Nonomuraea sp. LP-02]MED7929210.1 LLM class flavin-dependent oxidoreductase [Nonomuraea sp. LP-02]
MSAGRNGLGLICPAGVESAGQALAFGRCADRLGLGRLWLGQYFTLDPHQVHVHLAASGVRTSRGTSVTLTPLRHPLEAALQARGAAVLTGRPFVAGFGPGTPDFVASMLGRPYPSPLDAMRRYLTAVRGLLDGEAVRWGEHDQGAVALPELEHPAVEVGAGVLRPGMARVAGEVADCVITWMTPPDYLRDIIVPALEEGAAKAGRPGRPRVITVVHVATRREGRNPHALAFHAARAHLSQPNYAAMLRSAGLPIDPADPVSGARALVNFDVFVSGTPADVAGELGRYREAGVDEVVLNPCGVLLAEGAEAALRDVEEIVAAFAPRREADRAGAGLSRGLPADVPP